MLVTNTIFWSLSESTFQGIYGRIPDQYVDYWTSRFPRLLVHTWYSMHCIKNEPTFKKYFDKEYDFLQVSPHSGPYTQFSL